MCFSAIDNNRRKNEILQSFNGEYTLNSTKDKIAIISLFIALGLVTHRQNSNAGVYVSVRLSCEILYPKRQWEIGRKNG